MAKRMLAIAAVITVSFVIAIFAGSEKGTGVNVQNRKLEMSSAAVPEMITYQGVLTNAGGKPLDATVSMTFAIYNASSGGTALWTETHGSVTVVNGLFTVLLGSVTPLLDTVFDEPDRWLGLSVDGDPEMERERMASVPYAYKAGYADSVGAVGDHSHYALDAADGSPMEVIHVDDDGYVDIGTANQGSKLTVTGNEDYSNILTVTNSGRGSGIYSRATDTLKVGVIAVSLGRLGRGVHGHATGEDGCGVYGEGDGPSGCGVAGHGSYKGVDARSQGTYGVYASAQNYGVWATATGDNGKGIVGYTQGPNAVAIQAWGNDGIGILASGNTWAGQFGGDVLIQGKLGIGQYNPTHPLHMASGAHCTATGVWTDASSIKYKENVTDLSLEEALEALECLNPVTFNYKVDKEDEYVGFIAEEVPELVATKDREGLSPMDIVGVLTKVVQQQQETIAELNERIEKLERSDEKK